MTLVGVIKQMLRYAGRCIWGPREGSWVSGVVGWGDDRMLGGEV